MSILRKLTIALVLPSLVLIGVSCNSFGKWDINYDTGVFPDSVINLESVNTRFDDYNSSGPSVIGYNFSLVFSTNRSTEGETFDLISYDLYIDFDQHDGSLDVFGILGGYPYYYLTDLANTESNEFGPSTIAYSSQNFLFLFASDRTGNMDIYSSYFDQFTFSGGSMADPTPFSIQGINSDAYDAYPTFLPDASQIIFCSNRDGNLDFYRHHVEDSKNLLVWARADTTYQVESLETLNSEGPDEL